MHTFRTLTAELLVAAAANDPKELRKLGEEIRHRDDPAGFARQAYRQHQKRRLRLFDHPDGMLGIEGALPAARPTSNVPCRSAGASITPRSQKVATDSS